MFLGGTENCHFNRKTNVQFFDPSAFVGGLPTGGKQHLFTHDHFGTLELTYRPLTDITLTSVTGYFDIVSHSLGSGSGSTFAGPSFVSVGKVSRRDVTQEVRANSDFTSPFNFTAGAF